MQRSTVKWFDAKKGYGFIDHPEGGDDVFVHYSQILSEKDFKTLRTGQQVKFELNDGPKGLHALDVKPLEEPDEAQQQDDASTPAAASAETTGASAPSEVSSQEASPEAPSSQDEEEAEDEDEYEDDWDWDEEEWTDEHGNPPDPMAGPTF